MLPVQGQAPGKLSEEASAATEGMRGSARYWNSVPGPKQNQNKKGDQPPGQVWSELLAACCFG